MATITTERRRRLAMTITSPPSERFLTQQFSAAGFKGSNANHPRRIAIARAALARGHAAWQPIRRGHDRVRAGGSAELVGRFGRSGTQRPLGLQW